MPISVITNFSINDSVPFDTRLVATSSTSMDNMLYKYDGLTTYRSDLGLNYTYDGSTWSVSSNGIYGGSGNLSSANTTVNFGTVSSSLNSTSNKFVLKSYSGGDSNPNSLRVENYFDRYGSGYSGVSYKSQFIFSENEDQGIYYGAYIMYNPKPLFNSGRGGISFGVLPEGVFSQNTESADPYERMRIDGNGIIRFKPNSTVNDSTKSLNIGVDSLNDKPFIGFNWNGSTTDDSNPNEGSYVQFNDSVVSIHNFSSGTGTHSAIFSKGLVRVNGSLEVTGGTISTNKNISFGAADSGVYFVSSNGNGIKYDPQRGYAALTFKPSTVPLDILTWNNTQVSISRPIVATGSATITAYNTITSYFKSQMWDNVFNPDYGVNVPAKNADDYSDLVFKRTSASGENVKNNSDDENTANSNNIFVKQIGFSTGSPSDTVKTTGEFVIMIGASYVSSTSDETLVSKNTFSVDARDYDRIYYFYLDGMRLQIPHQVRWWLGEPGTTTNWIQIGNIETGNKFNNNRAATSYGSANDYASRYYSQTVLVPAGMAFKIQFRFHLTWNLDIASSNTNSPRVFMNVIRSGKFRRLGYVPPTTATTYTGGLGYPGSAADPNPPEGGG
jgi:hypothetical protein